MTAPAIVERIREEALSLAPRERASLAASLLSSLGPADLDVERAWLAEAQDRVGDNDLGGMIAAHASQVSAGTRREVIPADWLTRPTTFQDVEQDLAAEGASDHWLAEWRNFLRYVRLDDEVWEYFAAEQDVELWNYSADRQLEWAMADCWWMDSVHHCGYALVRDGVVFVSIASPWG